MDPWTWETLIASKHLSPSKCFSYYNMEERRVLKNKDLRKPAHTAKKCAAPTPENGLKGAADSGYCSKVLCAKGRLSHISCTAYFRFTCPVICCCNNWIWNPCSSTASGGRGLFLKQRLRLCVSHLTRRWEYWCHIKAPLESCAVAFFTRFVWYYRPKIFHSDRMRRHASLASEAAKKVWGQIWRWWIRRSEVWSHFAACLDMTAHIRISLVLQGLQTDD